LSGLAPYHAHIYYSDDERGRAERLRQDFQGNADILFVGRMTDSGVGPHPIPQYEVHFAERSRADVIEAIAASGLRALVHPLTDDDVADHTTLAYWIGEPVALDVSVLDPAGVNQGVPRFGKSDF
jgi:DOPA 4,5-dioxygenase